MNSFLQIKKTEINLGLKKEYKFFQISDIHMSYVDSDSSDLDKQENLRSTNKWNTLKREFATQFDEQCDEKYDIEANKIFEMLFDYAISVNSQAIILTGDVFDRITDSNIRYLKNYLKSIPIPVIYCPGNHEYMDIDHNYVNPNSLLAGLVINNGIEVIDYDEFLLVAFDNGGDEVTALQISTLEKAIQTGKKIVFAAHKPLNLGEFSNELLPKIGEYFFMGKPSDSESVKKVVNLVKENAEQFVAVLCGHIHTAQEYKIEKNIVQISTSSGLIGAGREIIIR